MVLSFLRISCVTCILYGNVVELMIINKKRNEVWNHMGSKYLPEWQNIYQDGCKAGFAITEAKRVHVGKPDSSVLYQMDTPYQTKDGQKVYGYASVKMDGPRHVHGLEFWIQDGYCLRNLEDVDRERGGKPMDLFQDGSWILQSDALDAMGSFAKAASNYPHVALYPEFAEVQTWKNQKFGFGEATPEDYDRYLDGVQRQMLAGDIQYIGSMTTVKDLGLARASRPQTEAETVLDQQMSEVMEMA